MNNCAVETKVSKKTNAYGLSTYIRFVNKALIFAFLFNVVFLPNDTFNIKIISLLCLLLLNILTFLNIKDKREMYLFLFGGIITSFTIVVSIFLTKEIYSNISMGYPGFIMLLYPIIKKYKINFEKIFISMLKFMAYFMVICALLDILKILDIMNNPILMWLHDTSNAMVGKGPHLPLYYMMFLKTSPLLFVALLYCLPKKQYFSAMVVAGAILVSGTRANMFMMIFVVAVYFCFLQKSKQGRTISIITFFIAGMIILIDFRLVEFVLDMFQRKSSSDSVRSGHLQGIFEYWNSNPINFIIGSGFSSKFYSYGVLEEVASIELSYWNLLRQVGIIPFILIMCMYLYPIFYILKKKRKNGIYLAFAYLAYLVISYTNPFLYSSTGVTLLLYMYWYCFNSKDKVKTKKITMKKGVIK